MNPIRKPRMFFEQENRPANVTFDDGDCARKNLPWSHFYSADWNYADPTAIRIEIGDWQVVISGHNLEPLFGAIEAARLARVRAYPEYEHDPTHETDVFAISIRFIHLASASPKRGHAAQLRLPM